MTSSTIQQLFDLTGKVAIVTGAGSGLGVTFAEGLAEAGAKVACAGRRIENVEQTAARLREAGRDAFADPGRRHRRRLGRAYGARDGGSLRAGRHPR